MPKISVIVPIFATERYVERCINSIASQTLHDIEIICVDDCSPDQSGEIVKRLMVDDKRVRYIKHEKNLGLGGARNTGIAAATAPYITGVDSDDFIGPEMLENLWAATDSQKVDVVECGFQYIKEDGAPIFEYRPKDAVRMNDRNQFDILRTFKPSFWSKLWKRSLFTENEILFPEHTYYEDFATTPRLLRFASEIRSISKADYNYVFRSDSIVNSTSPKHLLDYFKVFEILKSFLSNRA